MHLECPRRGLGFTRGIDRGSERDGWVNGRLRDGCLDVSGVLTGEKRKLGPERGDGFSNSMGFI